MANLSTQTTRGISLMHHVASAMSPTRLEQYRIDRLLELRAVIASLRSQEPDRASGSVSEEHCLET